MKKPIIAIVIVIVLGASLAWFKRVDVMLAVVKYKAQSRHTIAENREVVWQGDASSTSAIAATSTAQDSDTTRPPNIILIVADDLGYNDISTFGGGVAGGQIKTPNIDRLASEGAIFNQSYSGASTCAPSRAMMMTGRYPTRTGFEFTPTPLGMGKVLSTLINSSDSGMPPAFYDSTTEEGLPPYERMGLPASELTIAEVLQQRGYYTAHIGKWHLGREEGMAPHEQGFNDSLLMASGLYLPEDDPNVVNAKLDFDPIDKFLWASMTYAASFNSGNQQMFKPAGYLTDYWTDESLKVIQANKNRPFFLYLAHWGVHTPLQATREDYDAVGDIQPHRLRVYAAMIRALDRSVGRIMEGLEREGLADNTLIAFTSDNGGPGYLGLPDINAPYRGWKITQFEGGIRVPLFVKWPGKTVPGSRIDTPVAHIDMMPTLAAAAGAALPSNLAIDGLSVLPLLAQADSRDVQWPRQTLFWQNGHYQVVRHGDWKLQVNNRPTEGLVQWLYNLAEDPTEQHNLAASHPEKLQQLTALLRDHQATSRGALYPAAAQFPVLIDKTGAEKFSPGDEYVYTPN